MSTLRICHYLCFVFILPTVGFSQFRIGMRAGGTSSSVLFSSSLYTDPAQITHTDIQQPRITYYGGFITEFKLGKTFSIRPGIEYFNKGWKVDASDKGRTSTYRTLRTYNINYIQVPVNILMTTPLANGKVYVGLGPYAAFALNGEVRVNNKVHTLEFEKFNEPVLTYLPGESYKPVQLITRYTINRIDYGINGTVGYEFVSGLFLEAGIDIGMRQISTSYERYDLQSNKTIRDPGSSAKYSIFQIGGGWLLSSRTFRSK